MPRLKYFLVFIFCFPAFVTITAAQRPPLKAVTSTAGRIFVIQQRFDLTEERLKTKPQATKREIVIAAVVFEDGSFEGEPDGAAEMAAAMVGNSIQLTRVIPLLRRLVARTAAARTS